MSKTKKTETPTETTKAPEPRKGGLRAIAGGIVVVVIAGALGYYFLGGHQATAQKEDMTAQGQTGKTYPEVMKPGPLPDIAMGDKDAPVTLIEYSSMTCPHCRHFHEEILPKLKKKYIDTGKVKYIIREFPLDNAAAAAAMLARCVDKDKFQPFVETIYDRQPAWAYGEGYPSKDADSGKPDIIDRLYDTAKLAGFSRASFDKCIHDKELLKKIAEQRRRANEDFEVHSTPSFFVNGTKVTNVGGLADLEAAFKPILDAKSG